MAFGALMVLVTRPRDRVPLWIGGFLACVAASLLLAGTAGRTAGMLALAFLAAFLAEVRPGPWQRRAAVVVSLAVVAAALAGAQAFAQGLAAGGGGGSGGRRTGASPRGPPGGWPRTPAGRWGGGRMPRSRAETSPLGASSCCRRAR